MAATNAQKTDTAIALLDSVLAIQPTYSPALFQRGMLRFNNGDTARARRDLIQAAKAGYSIAEYYLTGDGKSMWTNPPLPPDKRGLTAADDPMGYYKNPPPRSTNKPLSASQLTRRSRGRPALAPPLLWWEVYGGALLVVLLLFALMLGVTRTDNVVEFPMNDRERQLWIGSPRQGLIFTRADFGITLVGAAICAFVFWLWYNLVAPIVWRDADIIDWLKPLFGVPFFAMGILIFYGRFFIDARSRKRTTYALTTQRAIVNEGSELTQYPLVTFSDVSVTHHGDGTGTLSFDSGDDEVWTEAIAEMKKQPFGTSKTLTPEIAEKLEAARGTESVEFDRVSDPEAVRERALDAIKAAKSAVAPPSRLSS